MTGLKIGYGRVSSDGQDLTAQRNALQALGVPADQLYVGHGLTGTNRDRPGLRQALAAGRAGDTLVVTKLDRLARSLPDARAIDDELTAGQIRLSLCGSVHDPTDPVGRLLFNRPWPWSPSSRLCGPRLHAHPRGHAGRPRQGPAQGQAGQALPPAGDPPGPALTAPGSTVGELEREETTVTGESDLTALLRGLSPRLNDGCYVSTQVRTGVPAGADPIVIVREDEGMTLILAKEEADQLDLAYEFVAAWITLEIHSALEAVGLIAAVSQVLTRAGITMMCWTRPRPAASGRTGGPEAGSESVPRGVEGRRAAMTGPVFNPRAMLAVLDRHHVEYVVVGGFAANVHGAMRPTKDIDVAPATTTQKLTRLAAALRELRAGIRVDELPEGLPFDTSAAALEGMAMLNLRSQFGDLDLTLSPGRVPRRLRRSDRAGK